MKTKLEILQENYDYYGKNPENRGVSKDGCEYITIEGKRCAIGKVSDVTKITMHDSHRSVANWTETNLEDVLEPEYHGHSFEFWRDLQFWHDDNRYWAFDGVSKFGQEYFDQLIRKYQ